jgi:two-component system LytT family sensor kinase
MKKAGIMFLQGGYWIMYAFLLCVFFLFSVFAKINGHIRPEAFFWWWRLMLGIAIVPGIIGFYSFYSFLFPRYLRLKKYFSFFAGAAISTILAGLAGVVVLALTVTPEFIASDNHWGGVIVFCITGFIGLINGVIGLVIKGFISWYGDIKLKEELQQKNYEAELALIKSRLSPHFLFNTINNIDILIEKDAPKASAYLNKLSDIMRFMLYESRTEKISIENELEYIGKYIELQKIRTANPDYVQYTVKMETKDVKIEPLLFIPFIENAFKHGESRKENSSIVIDFRIEKDTIYFECKNSYASNFALRNEYGGLGNDLIAKRLELLYPNRHQLEITDSNNLYTVKLTFHPHAN